MEKYESKKDGGASGKEKINTDIKFLYGNYGRIDLVVRGRHGNQLNFQNCSSWNFSNNIRTGFKAQWKGRTCFPDFFGRLDCCSVLDTSIHL